MKNIVTLFLLSACYYASGQKLSESEVPASVRSAFSSLYNSAKVRTWEKEKFGLYEAEFRWEGKATSATFNANGLLMRTETEVKKKDMPGAIVEHALKLYPAYKVKECALISTPDDKKLFEVEIAKGKDRKSLIFTGNNEYLREEVDEDDDDGKAKLQ